ncbi:hypothetical protein B0T26DRAFT_681485 [Lasiosphaeria miniovina]|uniref:Uncharacterized protein n=1 Tax=Lasiosphaeria miniovina TaxID=1954250 RepID=A0AA39ZUA3_9PEZI|nr:uncharacterized protein B0T26DRAFT_681485 [Lasiosphaeria miniovina]KAK0703861.1 hypothetical protein B0T26DRAFT_681485 [Lasiosphaeria miniovina]
MCKGRMLEALVKGASANGAGWTDGVKDRLEDKLSRLGITAENKYGLMLPAKTLNFDPNARHLAIDQPTWSSVADFVELHGWLLDRRQCDGCSCGIYNILGGVSLDVFSPLGWVDLVLKSARTHTNQEALDSWEVPIRQPFSSSRRSLCDSYSPSMSRWWRDGRNVSSTASQALSRLRNDAAHVLVKKVLEPEWKHACQKGNFRRLIKQGDELTDKSKKQANSDAAAAPNGGISGTLATPEFVGPSRPTRR